MSKWVIGLSLLAATCSCAISPVPMVPRPDTRRIGGVQFGDSTVYQQTMALFRQALPHEGAVCYTGRLEPRQFISVDNDSVSGWLAVLTGVTPARVDSTTEHAYQRNGTTVRVQHVWFPQGVPSGCAPPTIAIAHSHPMSTERCGGHSFDDVNVLFQATYAWFSMVWCSNGEVETLTQDGRRIRARWLPEP